MECLVVDRGVSCVTCTRRDHFYATTREVHGQSMGSVRGVKVWIRGGACNHECFFKEGR